MASRIAESEFSLRNKKILHFTAFDGLPGAAKSAHNIHRALLAHGAQSTMIVLKKFTDDTTVHEAKENPLARLFVRVRQVIRRITGKRVGRAYNYNEVTPVDLRGMAKHINDSVDVVLFYWTTAYLNTKHIDFIMRRSKCPSLWVMMDMEPITGGCHQSFGCEKYTEQCGNCPLLNSSKQNDISCKTLRKKKENCEKHSFVFVAPTCGVLEQTRHSTIASGSQVVHIPLAVETDIYRPISQKLAREVLGLEQEKSILFFGANDLQSPYKGLNYLTESLSILFNRIIDVDGLHNNDVELLVAGGHFGEAFEKVPYKVIYMGHCKDTRSMALFFQASDLYACPSTYDSGPVMIPEAMMCGIPVVAFDNGGARDLIESGENGYIARYKDSSDFANGILEILCMAKDSGRKMRIHGRAMRSNAPEVVSQQYVNLLDELTSKKRCMK